MSGISFRMTVTTYWRGMRIYKSWDVPLMYPERYISVIMGFISFFLVIRDKDRELYQ